MEIFIDLINIYIFGAWKDFDALNIVQGVLFISYFVIIVKTKSSLGKIIENSVSTESLFRAHLKLIIKLVVFSSVYAVVSLINRYRSDLLEPADGLGIILFSMALVLFNLVMYLVLKVIAYRNR